MKKWIALLLAMLMMATLCACGADKADDDKDTGKGGDKTTATTTTTTTAADDENNDADTTAATTITTTTTTNTTINQTPIELVGMWYMGKYKLKLNADGTGVFYTGTSSQSPMRWTAVNGVFTIDYGNIKTSSSYVFDGEIMTLTYEGGVVEPWIKGGS